MRACVYAHEKCAWKKRVYRTVHNRTSEPDRGVINYRSPLLPPRVRLENRSKQSVTAYNAPVPTTLRSVPSSFVLIILFFIFIFYIKKKLYIYVDGLTKSTAHQNKSFYVWNEICFYATCTRVLFFHDDRYGSGNINIKYINV